MIPFPFQAGGIGRRVPSGSGQMSFAAAANPVYATATTVAASTPAGIQNDDIVLAYVYARSALTPPSGWSLIDSQVCQNAAIAAQTLYVYRKNTVTSADSSTSFTWTQATSGRIGAGYVVARHSAGFKGILVRETAKAAVNNTSILSIAAQPLTAGSVGQDLMVAFCCTIVADPGAARVTPPTGMTNAQTGTIAENRMGAAYQVRDNQTSSSANFNFAGTPADNGLATITMRLSAA